MSFMRRLAGGFMTAVSIVGSVGLVGLMLVVGGTVIYRWFGGTFQGSYEVAETFTIVTITMAIVMATVTKGHVDVTLVYDLLPFRVRRALTVVLTLLGSFFFILVAWSALTSTLQLARRGEVTHVLQIDIVPFRWVITIGMAVVALILLVQAVQALREGPEE